MPLPVPGPALSIAAKDLRQRMRDRSAWILVFLAPLAITALMALAFTDSDRFHADIGYADLDHGPAATALAATLTSPELAGIVTVRTYDTQERARAAVEDGEVQAAVVIPQGFTASLNGNSPASIALLDDVDQPLAAQLARAVVESYTAQIDAARLSVGTAVAAGALPADVPALAAQAATERLPESVRPVGLSDSPLKAVSYFAPAMGMFFVLFTIGFGARGYFAEQRQGTLDRIAAAPVGRGALLLGKSLSTFVYSLAGLATTLTASWLLFGARWADPLGVALLCLTMAAAIVSLTALVISLARTEQQAQGLSSIVVFALVLLGGNFVFVSVAPPLIRRLALFTPNGWALRGFTDLGTGVGGWSAVGPPLLGMVAFTLAATALTALILRLRRPS
ncbi:ABC transporter permease [Streptomyces vilmorinianum]|uniref:ABC transporter permease n=1 Tax=Streptomyces vilmorinianum TaxID=3051092 RepID=UPI0010FBB88F|nr:ABC transporter permease [Streptomyces vilmorinianum]